MSRPLLHIGYHKTGTTWLQRSVFPDPKTGFSLVGGVKELQPTVVIPGPFRFDASRVRSALSAGFGDARERGLVPTLSFERLSGDPHHGGRDSGIIADRLCEAFPDARVLIVIREQRSMILSLYKTYVRLGGPATLEQYLRARSGPYLPPLFDFAYLEYHPLIKRYRSLFGGENVLALPYEHLRQSPRRFLLQVGKFAGAEMEELPKVQPMNVSYSAFALASKRIVNKWCVESNRNPTPVSPVRIKDRTLRDFTVKADRRVPKRLRERWDSRWELSVEKAVGGRYAESNAATAGLIGFNLGEFGYRL